MHWWSSSMCEIIMAIICQCRREWRRDGNEQGRGLSPTQVEADTLPLTTGDEIWRTSTFPCLLLLFSDTSSFWFFISINSNLILKSRSEASGDNDVCFQRISCNLFFFFLPHWECIFHILSIKPYKTLYLKQESKTKNDSF